MQAPSRPMWRRSLLVLTAVVICFAAVSSKLLQLQLVQHTAWQERAAEQQLTDSVISDKRGSIVDCKGEVLARSAEVATVIMAPAEIPDDATRTVICEELSTLLNVSRETLAKKVAKTGSRYEVVKAKMDAELCARFVDWVKERGYTAIFRVIQDYKREYPLGSTLSCVLGFTGTDNSGLEGLEARYNSVLAGKAGRVITTKNGWGDALPNDIQYETTVEAGEGNQLELTVDTAIQRMVEGALTTALAETGAANRASAIVMNVKTGAVLAMATKGDYDLNNPRVLQNADKAATIAQLAEDQRSAALLEALQAQWKNKAVSEFYEPGSVFKIFTASMAMQEGLISEQSHFSCGGVFTMSGVRPMKCHVYPRSHGNQTLAEAISHSCNPAFMKIGTLLGTTLFPKYHELFGFTTTTGIDVLGEARVTPTLYHSANAITAIDVVTSSIGQTFKVTPIQLITGVSAVAGGGELKVPYVVQKVTAPDGTVISETQPTVKRRVISQEVSSRISVLLEGVVDGGGAKNAYVAGYRVAGKTGTSEKTDQGTAANGRKNVVASFCGFAPADDPQIAVLVMIDEPQTAIRYGGTLAAPVAQKIFSFALPYLGVQPQYKEEELKALQRTVPTVTGNTTATATATLKAADLSVRIVGSGTQVTAQLPEAGAAIHSGGTVILYTDGERLESVKVPAVTGSTLAEANRVLTDAGLNLQINGWTQRDGSLTASEARVVSQSVAADTVVPAGTVVTLDIRYQDAIE